MPRSKPSPAKKPREIKGVLAPALLALVAYAAGLGSAAREVYATDFLFLFFLFLFLFRYASD